MAEKMGKGFELLSMIGLQIFLATIVVMTLLAQNKGRDTLSEEVLNSLTSENIEHFIQELTAVTTGQSKTLDVYGVTEYLMKHLPADGEYITAISFEDHNAEIQEEYMVMNRLTYISNILQAMKGVVAHEVTIKIENIDIAKNGKRAEIVISSLERGLMPMPDGSGGTRFMAMSTSTYCEQELILTDDNIIQLAITDCSTDINFLE